MRFKQRNRQPNTITRKKLYKSGNNWGVATTLALASGMILMGTTQETTVKADDNDVLTESAAATSVNSDNLSKNTMPTQKSGATESTDSSDENNSNTLTETKDDSKTLPSTAETTPATEVLNNPNNGTESGSGQTTTSTQQTTPDSVTNNGGIDDPDNITTSYVYGNVGKNDSFNIEGSPWYINSDGILHIGAGTWEGRPNFTWGDAKDQSSIKSIHFDGPVNAGGSISGLFYGLKNLTSLGNMKGNLNTSNTGSFSGLFTGTGLTSYDFSTLDLSNAYDLSSMFNGTKLKTVDMSKVKLPKLANIDDMFRDTEELTSADLSNLDFHTAELRYMFAESNISSIKLSGINTSNTQDVAGVFEGDSNLTDLDLTNFTMNDRSRDYGYLLLMFKGHNNVDDIKIKSITLNPTLNLADSELIFNTNLYDGWISDANPTAAPISSEKLMSLYNGTTSPAGIQKWTLADKKTVRYQINYFRSNQNPATDKPIAVKTNLSGIDGQTVTIPALSGYGTPTPQSETLDFSKGANQVFNVVSDVAEPYRMKVKINYEDNSKSDTTKELVLLGNPSNIADDSTFQSDLNTLPNNNQTLDLEKTTFDLGSIFNSDPLVLRLKDFADIMNISSTETNLKTIINGILDFANKSGKLTSGGSGEPVDFVDAYYGTYEAPVVTPPIHINNGGSSTPEPEREVDDINQTSATYSDQPKVQLYDFDGNVIDDVFLNPNTSWHNDKKMILNGMTYYRVATDEWVKSSDVYVYIGNNTYIRVYNNNYGQLINAHGKKLSRVLKQSTDWLSDRTTNINGEKYYRVATNEFVKADDVYEYVYDLPVVSTNRSTPVYDERGNVTTVKLPTKMSYKTDRYENIDGQRYYRIATNQFVKADDVNLIK